MQASCRTDAQTFISLTRELWLVNNTETKFLSLMFACFEVLLVLTSYSRMIMHLVIVRFWLTTSLKPKISRTFLVCKLTWFKSYRACIGYIRGQQPFHTHHVPFQFWKELSKKLGTFWAQYSFIISKQVWEIAVQRVWLSEVTTLLIKLQHHDFI